MDYKSLEVFVTLANRLSFRHTSEIHNMTPSTLSRVIQRLEEEMDCALFIRDNKSVSLTRKGEEFCGFAKDALDKFESLKSSFNNTDPKLLKGSINLCTSVTTSLSILPPVIKDFVAKYPNVSINLTTGASYKNIDFLLDNLYDFIIQSGGGITCPDTLKKVVSKTDVVLICPLGRPVVKSLEDLNKMPFIMSQYPDFNKYTKALFKKYKIKPKITNYIDGHEAICSMVAANIGYALLPKIVIENSSVRDKFVVADIAENLLPLDIAVRMKNQKYISPVKAAFWDFWDDYKV